jgi:hypothetical protein
MGFGCFKKMNMKGDVEIATGVGTAIGFIHTINMGNVISTIFLSALGAIASYLATTSFKWLVRKIKLKIQTSNKKKFHDPN